MKPIQYILKDLKIIIQKGGVSKVQEWVSRNDVSLNSVVFEYDSWDQSDKRLYQNCSIRTLLLSQVSFHFFTRKNLVVQTHGSHSFMQVYIFMGNITYSNRDLSWLKTNVRWISLCPCVGHCSMSMDTHTVLIFCNLGSPFIPRT